MSSNLKKNTKKLIKISILASILIFSNKVNAAPKNLQLQYPDVDAPSSVPNLPKPKPRVSEDENSVKASLNLFKVSCDGIKYTGALEQVAIDGLSQTKEAVTKMLLPYLSLSSFEAALWTASFLECLVTVSMEEVKGDEVHESSIDTAISSVDKSRTGVTLTAGATIGSASGGVETDVDFFPDIAGTFNAFLKTKVNDGWFDDIMQCIQEKRTQNYEKIYDFLNQQFTLNLNYQKMAFSQCNVSLLKEGETVPSWNAMFGNKISEYTNDFMDTLNNNSVLDTEVGPNSVCTATDQSTCPPNQYKLSEVKNTTPIQKVVQPNLKVVFQSVDDATNTTKTPLQIAQDAYPTSKGYTVTDNGDGTFKVEQDTYKVGAGTKAKHIPAVQKQLEDWDAEQQRLSNSQEVQTPQNTTALKGTKQQNENCVDGASSTGSGKCLTAAQAKDYRKNQVKTTPNTMTEFITTINLTKIEEVIFKINQQNPKGFADVLEYVYDKLKMVNYQYTVASKNTNTGMEDLNYVDTFTINWKDNFKLTFFNTDVDDIDKIFLQNENGDKIAPPSDFARALLKRIVMEVTHKRIPIDKKITNTNFDTVMEIYKNHRDHYIRFIDLKYMLSRRLIALDGTTPIMINPYNPDSSIFLNEIKKFLLEQRKAINAMFVHTNQIIDDQGATQDKVTTTNSDIGIAAVVSGMNKKDYRQELIKRVNQHILEYKFIGETGKIRNIKYFYKMFLFYMPTSIKDEIEIQEKKLNHTIMAKDYYKRTNLMHGILMQNFLLERARNFKVIEKNIDKSYK
jgi:hypothetical protein